MRAHHAKHEQQFLQAFALGPDTTIDTLVGRPKFGIAATPSRETMRDQPTSSGTACTDKGSFVCFAAATVKAWASLSSAIIDEGSQGDEWLVRERPGQTSVLLPYASASVGIGRFSAEAGTALVEDNDQQANRAPHLKPKRIDEAESFVEQFGVEKDEWDLDILRGHRASDGRPLVKVGGVGKCSIADALD